MNMIYEGKDILVLQHFVKAVYITNNDPLIERVFREQLTQANLLGSDISLLVPESLDYCENSKGIASSKQGDSYVLTMSVHAIMRLRWDEKKGAKDIRYRLELIKLGIHDAPHFLEPLYAIIAELITNHKLK